MINMVKADSYRTVRNVAIYIAFGIAFLLICTSLYLCEPGAISMSMSVGDDDTVAGLESPTYGLTVDEFSDMTVGEWRDYVKTSEGYQFDRDIMSKNINLYYIFIFAAAIIITADFSTGAVKNTLSSAISREKYFASKTIGVFALCILTFLGYTYLTYFLNLWINGSNLSSSLWIMTRTALLQLPVMLAFISILTGLAFILKKTALYNVITIPLMMVGQVIFGTVVNNVSDLPDKVMNYDFQTMLQILTNVPSENYIAKCYILCCVVCVMFLAAGWLSFRKAEIK